MDRPVQIVKLQVSAGQPPQLELVADGLTVLHALAGESATARVVTFAGQWRSGKSTTGRVLLRLLAGESGGPVGKLFTAGDGLKRVTEGVWLRAVRSRDGGLDIVLDCEGTQNASAVADALLGAAATMLGASAFAYFGGGSRSSSMVAGELTSLALAMRLLPGLDAAAVPSLVVVLRHRLQLPPEGWTGRLRESLDSESGALLRRTFERLSAEQLRMVSLADADALAWLRSSEPTDWAIAERHPSRVGQLLRHIIDAAAAVPRASLAAVVEALPGRIEALNAIAKSDDAALLDRDHAPAFAAAVDEAAAEIDTAAAALPVASATSAAELDRAVHAAALRLSRWLDVPASAAGHLRLAGRVSRARWQSVVAAAGAQLEERLRDELRAAEAASQLAAEAALAAAAADTAEAEMHAAAAAAQRKQQVAADAAEAAFHRANAAASLAAAAAARKGGGFMGGLGFALAATVFTAGAGILAAPALATVTGLSATAAAGVTMAGASASVVAVAGGKPADMLKAAAAGGLTGGVGAAVAGAGAGVAAQVAATAAAGGAGAAIQGGDPLAGAVAGAVASGVSSAAQGSGLSSTAAGQLAAGSAGGAAAAAAVGGDAGQGALCGLAAGLTAAALAPSARAGGPGSADGTPSRDGASDGKGKGSAGSSNGGETSGASDGRREAEAAGGAAGGGGASAAEKQSPRAAQSSSQPAADGAAASSGAAPASSTSLSSSSSSAPGRGGGSSSSSAPARGGAGGPASGPSYSIASDGSVRISGPGGTSVSASRDGSIFVASEKLPLGSDGSSIQTVGRAGAAGGGVSAGVGVRYNSAPVRTPDGACSVASRETHTVGSSSAGMFSSVEYRAERCVVASGPADKVFTPANVQALRNAAGPAPPSASAPFPAVTASVDAAAGTAHIAACNTTVHSMPTLAAVATAASVAAAPPTIAAAAAGGAVRLAPLAVRAVAAAVTASPALP